MKYYKSIEKNCRTFGFTIVSKNFNKPWGAFLVIDESQSQVFQINYLKA
jgi:hypothetical protein